MGAQQHLPWLREQMVRDAQGRKQPSWAATAKLSLTKLRSLLNNFPTSPLTACCDFPTNVTKERGLVDYTWMELAS